MDILRNILYCILFHHQISTCTENVTFRAENPLFLSQIILLGSRSNLCNLENRVFENSKEFPDFGHKMKTKPQMKNLRHGSLQESP